VTTGSALFFEVDDTAFVRLCRETTDGLARFVDEIERDLVTTADIESAPRHITWHRDTARDAVVADQWFAHFLARGTQAHGPLKKEVMMFKIDQDLMWAEFVAGIRPDPFHERAVAAEGPRIDSLLNQMLSRAGTS